MAGPTGRGNSRGAALGDLLRAQVTPRHRLSTYSAKHWHAQLSQLTGTRRGYEALESAGLDAKPDTLIKWLSDPEYNVRRSYRDLIHTAYENVAIVPADPIPDHVKNGQFEISGLVKTGADERERGNRRAAPCASTEAAATGATSRRSGWPATCATTTSRTASSTTSSSPTSAKAQTAGNSLAAATPLNSGNTPDEKPRMSTSPEEPALPLSILYAEAAASARRRVSALLEAAGARLGEVKHLLAGSRPVP
ncbi:hypothetical protein ACWDBO_46205 [Streptomyces mirabilis]